MLIFISIFLRDDLLHNKFNTLREFRVREIKANLLLVCQETLRHVKTDKHNLFTRPLWAELQVPNIHTSNSQPLVPQNMTVFRDMAFKE